MFLCAWWDSRTASRSPEARDANPDAVLTQGLSSNRRSHKKPLHDRQCYELTLDV